ncbi:hypothetical protein GCM10007079_11580 [Nocardiopsis terrae]|uniref:Membrane protease YdiL (CAAX protease family) n=1 Tax=Nocardiopsis terrae TaxID=372655 RepID=A0ABR9HCW0_9ACTN|nr:CPBP family intramembrane glutamic endopeptidase [Nocardiopsis terrae]MBE1456630.1 membrane protease YdiL (CAAX protease family) [Nocardiopsis terrae]GHC75854.1 hypothetical protein GCM10007079_11580 [Nocardiopsis terrae]
MPPEFPVPDFSAPALAVAAVMAAYLLLVEPLWGKSWFERMKRDRDTDPNAFTRLFGWGMVGAWGMTALVAAAVLLSPGVSWAHLGFTPGMDWSLFAGIVAGAFAGTALFAFLAWRYGFGPQILTELRPRNGRERRYAVGVSVTAGICEEIVFRGLFIAVGVSLGLPLYAAAGISLAIFTLAHLYQGPKAMAGVGLIGFFLTYLYLSTGSLLLPILLHVLIDLRGFLLTPEPRSADREPESVATAA